MSYEDQIKELNDMTSQGKNDAASGAGPAKSDQAYMNAYNTEKAIQERNQQNQTPQN